MNFPDTETTLYSYKYWRNSKKVTETTNGYGERLDLLDFKYFKQYICSGSFVFNIVFPFVFPGHFLNMQQNSCMC